MSSEKLSKSENKEENDIGTDQKVEIAMFAKQNICFEWV